MNEQPSVHRSVSLPMLRTIIFTIYGICVGIGYSVALWNFNANDSIGSTFWSVAAILLCGGAGWSVGGNSEYSNVQALLWVTLAPLIPVYAAVAWAVFLLVMVPYWWLSEIFVHARKRRELMNTLALQGRYVELPDLTARLESGEGTLIHETGTDGPNLVWWTTEDLFALGTPPSPDEFFEIVAGENNQFNDECVERYLARTGGQALLTPIPARHVCSGKLARMYPKMRVAMLVNLES